MNRIMRIATFLDAALIYDFFTKKATYPHFSSLEFQFLLLIFNKHPKSHFLTTKNASRPA